MEGVEGEGREDHRVPIMVLLLATANLLHSMPKFMFYL